jgi:hypothetical protein
MTSTDACARGNTPYSEFGFIDAVVFAGSSVVPR